MREPVLFRQDPSMEPVMQLALSSDKQTLAEISRLAEDQLADRFRGINGVSTVNVNGFAAAANCPCCCMRRNCASTT